MNIDKNKKREIYIKKKHILKIDITYTCVYIYILYIVSSFLLGI